MMPEEKTETEALKEIECLAMENLQEDEHICPEDLLRIIGWTDIEIDQRHRSKVEEMK